MTIPLVLLTAAAAVCDARLRRIPNWLTLPGIAAGLAWHTWFDGWAGLAHSAQGAGLAFAVYFGLFLLRAVGAGDLKLSVAVGAMAGPKDWLTIFTCTALVGGAIALTLLLVRGGLGRALRNIGVILASLVRLRAPYRADEELDIAHPRAVTLPHAIAIAVGTLLFLALR